MPTTSQITEARRLAAAAAELRVLVGRFYAEGQDEMFVDDLDTLVHTWERTAKNEEIGYDAIAV
jgi:hypothetical protein